MWPRPMKRYPRPPDRNKLVSVTHRYDDVYDVVFEKPAGERLFTCRRSSLQAAQRRYKRLLKHARGKQANSIWLALLCCERKLAAIEGRWNPTVHEGGPNHGCSSER